MRVSYANRGMALEQMIEYANSQYAAKGWAVIQKVATPFKVVRRGKEIVSAYPEEKSTVDFVGVSGSRALAFDAKSTMERTRFPLGNIEQHQMDFLKAWQDHGGISFFLIEFAKHREIYVVPYSSMQDYWVKAREGGRKSIPFEEMAQFAKARQGRGVVLDYLAEVM
ncbi:Holliday junction resolvase RecU [Cohnella massiliensis]|uniref:Holliday junction resolvase RecU n=1 Tax=Paenibacillaceae TaxID=186822 RepID=UPI0009BBCFEC|nr:Holliday junction resolvase RecU [Cohnella massiliensis]